MDPEMKHLLEETHSLARDNHRMLRSVRRHQLIGAFWKLALWLIVLGFAFFGYQQYLKPLADMFSGTYLHASGPFGLPTSADMQKLIDSYKVKQ